MLPRTLCEDLCSLNPSEDRLTFSVEWVLDADTGKVETAWFGRSVIRSCVKMAYEHAQDMLDNPAKVRGLEHFYARHRTASSSLLIIIAIGCFCKFGYCDSRTTFKGILALNAAYAKQRT